MPVFNWATTAFVLLNEESTPEVSPSVVLMEVCSMFRWFVVTASTKSVSARLWCRRAKRWFATASVDSSWRVRARACRSYHVEVASTTTASTAAIATRRRRRRTRALTTGGHRGGATLRHRVEGRDGV